jgi:hypothetical protein
MLRLSSSYVDREETYAHFAMPTVIETNAIAAFAPQHAESLPPPPPRSPPRPPTSLDTDDTDEGTAGGAPVVGTQ